MTKLKIDKKDKVVILTGAGISAESGVRTFRDKSGKIFPELVEIWTK